MKHSSSPVPTSQICRVCHEEKPISEFYLRDGNFYDKRCKSCLYTYNLQHPEGDRRIARVASERMLIEKLHHIGIPALPGKALGQSFADVIAWGCVLIECKYSQIRDGQYLFTLTPHQRERGFRADVVVLMCANGDDVAYHLFSPLDIHFYRKDGKLKRGVCYLPNAKHRKEYKLDYTLTDEVMAQAKDAWHFIEERKIVVLQELAHGVPNWLTNTRIKHTP